MAAAYLKIGGDLIKDAVLVSVEITQELNHHWWCKIECRQTEDKRFPTEQCLGQDVQVLTFDQGGKQSVVFDGFIFDVELTYEVWGSYTAQLLAVTRSYKMDQTPRKAYYAEKTLSDVAQELAGHCSLQAQVKGPARKALNYVQWGESDFDFLNRLADDYGCWMRPTAMGVEISSEFQDEVTLKWREEEGLLKFKTKGTLGPPSFNGAHYDHHEMNSETYKEVSDDARFFDSIGNLVQAVKTQSKNVMPPGYVHQRSRVMKLDDYQTLLKKESVRSIGGNITGHGESRNQQLLPGNKIKIEGELDAHGTYGVLKVIHRWTSTGYLNEFVCTPWKDYVNPEPPTVRPWFGVVPASVVEHNDPKKMGRIKVQYFWQEDNKAHWARMISPHAGHNRGFMFMPEEGDEVAVAFEDGDPERPIIIGSLWNGGHPAPRAEFWGGELTDNDVKRIVTKSGHRIQFVDKKGKEAIVIATPTRLKISLIEKTDENNRSVITMHSEDGDIYLSAPNGQIHLRSKHFTRETS